MFIMKQWRFSIAMSNHQKAHVSKNNVINLWIDGLYKPFMIKMAMVYYSFANINAMVIASNNIWPITIFHKSLILIGWLMNIGNDPGPSISTGQQ